MPGKGGGALNIVSLWRIASPPPRCQHCRLFLSDLSAMSFLPLLHHFNLLLNLLLPRPTPLPLFQYPFVKQLIKPSYPLSRTAPLILDGDIVERGTEWIVMSAVARCIHLPKVLASFMHLFIKFFNA